MTKRIISGYYPSKAARKLHSAEPEMQRLDQISDNVDAATKLYSKKSDKYTKPL